MTKPHTSSVFKKMTVSTNNLNDAGYHHCFEQKSNAILTFVVETDSSVDTVSFVLWDLQDFINPKMAEPSKDGQVQNGQVTIMIGPDRGHLGPGPYCAALTAMSSTAVSAESKSAGKVVGNALHYYETWKGIRKCKY